MSSLDSLNTLATLKVDDKTYHYFRLALAENRGVIIAVRAGGFAVLQGILTIHFKGNAGILADHVKLLAFLCAVAIESESAVSTA